MGFQDPEVTIWNAIPMSFVADYVLNIGDWLQARATAAALPSGLFVTSTKNEERLTSFLGNKYLGTGFNVTAVNGLYERMTTGSFSRSVSSSLSVPTPKFKPLGADTAWQRVATICSLQVVFEEGGLKADLRKMR
jgi:hypothetical protein